MDKRVSQKAATYQKRSKRRTLRYRIITFLCAVIVFITTYMLILPAITMEPETPFCGLSEHVHDDSCYKESDEIPSISLICSPKIHTHEESCYDSENGLICRISDFIIHTHNDLCYHNGQLICNIEEATEHTHCADCFETGEKLICTEAAEDGGHTHTDECFESTTTLICKKAEAVIHCHADLCYTQICCEEECETDGCTDESHEKEDKLICTATVLEEHVHSKDCISAPDTDKTSPDQNFSRSRKIRS